MSFFIYSKCVIADELEDRVKELEAKIAEMDSKGSTKPEGTSAGTKIYGNEFNPSIGIILNGKYTIRIVIGQTEVEMRHVEKAWQLIEEYSNYS